MANWEVDVLKLVGAPATKQNLKFLRSWQAREGGWTHNDATFNPLNTTHGPGRSINSVGVKQFADYDTGMRMTADTILNGRYPNIVQGLRAGNPYKFDIGGDLSTWVSGSRTKGLDYARRVTGGRGVASQPTHSPTPQSTFVPAGFPAQKGRKQAARAMLAVAMSYAKTGQINNNKMAKALGAVSRLGTVEPPSYKTAKAQARTPLANGVADRVLAAAHEQVGKPYVFGSGPDTSSFDCSDLIQWAYKQVGIEIPRTTFDQVNVGRPVDPKNLKPGDLVFPSDHHVVMYVGGGKVIAAPHTGTVVQYQPLSRFGKLYAVRRIIE